MNLNLINLISGVSGASLILIPAIGVWRMVIGAQLHKKRGTMLIAITKDSMRMRRMNARKVFRGCNKILG